jgi:hypothetical protein
VSTGDFPEPIPGAGIDSQTEFTHGTLVVLRNCWLVCWAIMSVGISAAFIALCMAMLVLSLVFPLSDFSLAKGWNALLWALSAFIFGSMCPWMWTMGRRMLDYEVRLDSRGAEFKLGTKREPSNLFLTWDRIAAITHQRVGNAQEYRVLGTDGSKAIFTSYTFLRPKKVALTIADRAGKSIQTA